MREGVTRRSFIQTAAAASVGLGVARPVSAAIQARGANDRIVVAVMGVNGRGAQLARVFAGLPNTTVGCICDVEDGATKKGLAAVAAVQTAVPKTVSDIRRVVEDRDIDAVAIAAPDHWHAPAAILACAAGKDVYVEKPCGHNAREGELLVAAARKYRRIVQMGNQRRSWPNLIELTRLLWDGSLIGDVYFARGWYVNTRASIGVGREMPVPAGLDYELWQGPAPRRAFRDNIVHYNWHWFWHWGTSEACNNGTHEVDLMRWGMGLEFPTRVDSTGGRYAFKDDWECADTQVATFQFPDGRTFIWEGRSCNGFRTEGLARGVTFHGTGGTVLVDDNAYTVYDQDRKVVKKVTDVAEQSTTDTTGPGDRLDSYHLVNFLESVRSRQAPSAEIEGGHRSVLLCHLANVSQRVGRTVHCDPTNGHIRDDAEAQALWGRSYEPGWEPEVVTA